MTGSTWADWAALLALLALASAAGATVAARMPWSNAARSLGLDIAVGFGLGPFLSGLLAIGALGFLPGAPHGLHLALVLSGLTLITALAVKRKRHCARRAFPAPQTNDGSAQWAFTLLIAAWTSALLAGTILTPLTQNDALEYATVGRILFETRALSGSPPITPDANSTGFYHPWTHPPLYVALIYLANLLQGHADSPGLLRMIAPWCALAAMFVVHRLGSRMGRIAGAGATILLISTPLFFLGATGALIDALPILGVALILAVVTGIEATPAVRGALTGMVLGAALWTHSQAVLLLPLTAVAIALYRGLSNRRSLLLELVATLGTSVTIGCWPYLRNMALLGSLVSDNPAVFALPQQAWTEYFPITRGVEHVGAIIQYGVLKGLFALETYSLTFWAMLLGAIQYLAIHGRSDTAGDSGRDPADSSAIIRASLAMVGCYVAGIIASVLVGLDIMIKNERYILIVLPAVALVFAFALRDRSSAFDVAAGIPVRPTMRDGKGRRILIGAFLSVAALQLVGLSGYLLMGGALSAGAFDLAPESRLRNRPDYSAARYLAEATDSSALVLTLKPADMYYSGRKMVSYLDPRLLPFYGENDPGKAAMLLRALGITHVHVPSYHLPSVYNSALQKILRDPRLSTLGFSAAGYQVYALKPSDLFDGATTNLTPGPIEWRRSENLILGGRKAFRTVTLDTRALEPGKGSSGGLPLGFLDRDLSITLTSAPIAIEPDGEYGIDLDVAGHGAVRVSLIERNGARAPGEIAGPRVPSRTTPIGDFFLSQTQSERSIAYRLRIGAATNEVILVLEHFGHSRLEIRHAALVHLVPAQTNARPPTAQ